jgi:hypothetical protein
MTYDLDLRGGHGAMQSGRGFSQINTEQKSVPSVLYSPTDMSESV